jgi:hypothetical protein
VKEIEVRKEDADRLEELLKSREALAPAVLSYAND